ncbi:dTDP-glucose pyrophosphorylase [Thermoplasma sp. Kam2015]|uniref:nucleotidyltransferase family protein n=1 Tax=Thermoplasma sp. Kam2015 TaxID=2094122 RepID=UPI000D999716|nr:sugar phosphate nucleotidyltransferase [Thermoplasma sp. Kam2015]PYB67968.1 dTDP-glucose pyrophosphorylase [Thermoplasma sp. Kam2015]
MKGLITAAGLGKRSMASKYYRKELFSVYDFRDGSVVIRPILDAVIYRMKYIGVNEIYIVLDQEDGVTKKFIEDSYPELQIIIQKERRGYGYAVYLAREYMDSPFILNAGDGMIIDPDLEKDILKRYRFGNILVSFRVEDPTKYGVVKMEEDAVVGVVEKPKVPPSNMALAALYILDPSVFNFIDTETTDSELTPAIDAMIRKGVKTDLYEITKDQWISVGQVLKYVDVVNRTYKFATDRMSSVR